MKGITIIIIERQEGYKGQVLLTDIEGDVMATVCCLQPAGHFLQGGYLTANDNVWPCDVHLYVRVRHLIG